MALRASDIVKAVEEGNLRAMIDALESFPLKVDSLYNNTAPLHVASRRGNLEAIKHLARSGADLNICDLQDNTPLHYAVKGNQPEAVSLLLNLGAKIDEENDEYLTPPQVAFKGKHNECVKMFLERDRKVKLKDSESAFPSDLNENEEMFSNEAVPHDAPQSGYFDKCLYCKTERAVFTYEPCGCTIACLKCCLPKAACISCGTQIQKVSFQEEQKTMDYINYVKKLEKENMELKQNRICGICVAQEIQCTLSCGHLFCINCVRKRESPRKNERNQQLWICSYCKKDSRFTKIFL